MADERTVLVTGGGRGIGAGIVAALAAEGWRVAFCGRKPANEVEPQRAALEKEYGVPVHYARTDVADLEAHAALLDDVENKLGPLTALVNNAGVAPDVRLDLLATTSESFDRVLNINLRGPFFLTQAVARRWAAAREADPDFRAVLVNIGSISATVASVSRGEYCLAKSGVAMATKLFAVRLADLGIPAYEVRPGVIESDMTSAVKERYDALIAGGLTLQPRWGAPADVGRAVAMLLRGDLAYSTGQVIHVDGGLEVARL